MHGGNGMEIYWRNNSICPTEKEYLDVVVPSKIAGNNISFLNFP
jgi:hypothetical protein